MNRSLIESDIDERFEHAVTAYEELESSQEEDEDQEETTKQLPPEQLYVALDEFRESMADTPRLHLGGFSGDTEADWHYRLDASPQPDFNGSIKLLRENIQQLSKQSYDTYILCDNEGQRDRFEELLGDQSKDLRYHLAVETIHKGFTLNKKGLAVYTDHQIFNRYHRPKVRRKRHTSNISMKELRDLNIGDYVVHVDYGIGKFAGFKKIEVRDVEQESVVLRYQENSLLYVNVTSLHKIQKYSGKEGTQPRIASWDRQLGPQKGPDQREG
ncbi:MAG: CarD family transcriptional regulator [Fodinibius sp.]|nr:CarD family transcriptional regulator [Fodinibius sp.]